MIARDSQGRLYTTEGTAGRVQQFSAEGKVLASWGDKSKQDGGFGDLKTGYSKNGFGPIGILVDRQDRVWVSSLNDRVQAFTPEGKFLFGIGGTGKESGQFARPHGMAFYGANGSICILAATSMMPAMATKPIRAPCEITRMPRRPTNLALRNPATAVPTAIAANASGK